MEEKSVNPLVSCIMPTYNRSGFIQAAIDCWLRQDYEPLELIIINDGDSVENMIPNDERILYARCDRMNTGAKRNLCVKESQGEIICQFDDDDWSDSQRISKQVALLEKTGKPVTGYSQMLYWNPITGNAQRWKSSVKCYVIGASLCYRRDWWEQNHFPDKMKASDNDLIYKNLQNIAAVNETGMMVCRAHDSNIGGDKKKLPAVDRRLIPAAFWVNEELRIGK